MGLKPSIDETEGPNFTQFDAKVNGNDVYSLKLYHSHLEGVIDVDFHELANSNYSTQNGKI